MAGIRDTTMQTIVAEATRLYERVGKTDELPELYSYTICDFLSRAIQALNWASMELPFEYFSERYLDDPNSEE